MKQLQPLSPFTIPSGLQTPEDADRLKNILIKMAHMRQVLGEMHEEGFHLIPNSRRLKIQSVSRNVESGLPSIAPSIHLSGWWLQKTGFECYEHVYIINLPRLIIICPENLLPEPRRLKKRV